MHSAFAAIADTLETDWRSIARPEQLAPSGDWSTWLILAGRGAGKTRSGAEWTRGLAEAASVGRIALVGPTAADARDTMVEGESGLLAICPNSNRPIYEPSKRRLTWQNGVVASLFSSEEPERLRGPQFGAAWADELCAWRNVKDTWSNLQFGLRLGKKPRQVVTTTPRPIKLLNELIANPDTVVTRGSTYDNRDNLAPSFFSQIVKRYEGTRLGRQELNAEILNDVQGALWTRDLIEEDRRSKADLPPMRRIVVALDPAVTSGEDSDETGIIVAGLGVDEHGYVLEDGTGKFSPIDWARRAVVLYRKYGADRIVAEANQGGTLVETTIRTVDQNVSFKAVHASRGKITRAEPIAALAEQHRIHLAGAFPELEDQLCSFEAGSTASPDRLDAMVWALTELMIDGAEPGIIGFYKMLNEERARGEHPLLTEKPAAMVKMLAPPGVSHLYTMDGKCIAIPADRVVSVAEDQARSLERSRAGWTRDSSIPLSQEITP
jgi:predicted phage terminase large subunit-like protein